jgi:hypothetical protein
MRQPSFIEHEARVGGHHPPALSHVGEGRHNRARRGVAETSREAFHSLPVADYLAPKERAVLALFTGPGVKLSRQQISARLPMPINCVCGRVDSLLAAGHLQECGDRIDPLTRKRQKLLQLPRPAKGDLLEAPAS